jgi:Leucine-rich repeat (LRR) protein
MERISFHVFAINIFDLSSLIYLNFSGCSRVFNNPRHLNISENESHSISKLMTVSPTPTTHTNSLYSLCSLYCLREVDVSFCGLKQFPDAIGYLRQLERLNLTGNNFVSLPSLNESISCFWNLCLSFLFLLL